MIFFCSIFNIFYIFIVFKLFEHLNIYNLLILTLIFNFSKRYTNFRKNYFSVFKKPSLLNFSNQVFVRIFDFDKWISNKYYFSYNIMFWPKNLYSIKNWKNSIVGFGTFWVFYKKVKIKHLKNNYGSEFFPSIKFFSEYNLDHRRFSKIQLFGHSLNSLF